MSTEITATAKNAVLHGILAQYWCRNGAFSVREACTVTGETPDAIRAAVASSYWLRLDGDMIAAEIDPADWLNGVVA